ncbi:MAG TPA: pitrilysin family protein [Kofleriaceae bacterium]|jgi:predicted Zn-dependent peptidase
MTSEPVAIVDDLPYIAAERSVLPCGLQLVLHRDSTVPQTMLSVWYRVGSSDERPDRTGFAHLFEHLFKSPPSRLGGHHYEVLKRAGSSEANASTSSERTAYYEIMPSHALGTALWIESDRMGYFAPLFDTDRLAAQQKVVRQERVQRYENVPYGAERFAVGLALYPDGHPMRHLTIGRHEDIQAATYDDVLAFYRTWYVPANATLVIAGDIPDDLDAQLEKYFGTFPTSARPDRQRVATPTPAAHSEKIVDRFAALGRLHRAWLGPPALADDEASLDIVTAAWSTPGTGALWRRLVYETELAQRVAAWTVNGRLGGEVHVAVDLRTGADPARVRAILDEELARGVDERSISRVVTRREAGTIWSLSQLARRVGIIQRGMLYSDDPAELAKELVRYRNVTPASIAAALARWVQPDRMIEIETVPAAAPG